MNVNLRNKNIILFTGYVAFIIIGVLSSAVLRPVGGSFYRLIRGQYDFEEAKSTINAALTDDLTYHDELVNLNGLRENILGTRVIYKDDAVIVKAESGSLINIANTIDEEETSSIVSLIQELQVISKENGADFLYCAAPEKEMYEKAPINIDNYSLDNYYQFLSLLTKAKIPYIDCAQVLDEADIPTTDLFYYSDHHWKVYPGFVAANAICKELSTRYNYYYNKQYADISNYDIEKYTDWFLGSKGRKTGIYFSEHGADDFELIIPKFKTDLTEEQPYKNHVRRGKFEESVLYMENMRKNPYRVNTYATYSGGDFRLQIMKNNLNPDGKKILLIRDSFACVVAPFMALQTGELYICDVRSGDEYVGDKVDMETYIKQIKPDCVLVLYTGVGNLSDSRYDFFPIVDSMRLAARLESENIVGH